MKERYFKKQITVQILKELIKDLPDDMLVNACADGCYDSCHGFYISKPGQFRWAPKIEIPDELFLVGGLSKEKEAE